MPQISKYVRDALKNQLSAANTGLNGRLAALWTPYGIAQDDQWSVDWSADSTNFLFGRPTIQAVQQSSVLSFPFVAIDTLRSQHTNRVKFGTFAGPIQAVIDVHHSWGQEAVLQDFASLVDATEDAMVGCLNDQSAQFWPGSLLWNGNVALQRGPLAFGGRNWLQTVSFLCTFELTV